MKHRKNEFPQSPADDRIRQGHIVLNTPGRRLVFFGAFVAVALFVIVSVILTSA